MFKLPAEVQLGLRDKRVDMGHARALLSIEKPSLQLKLYNEIIKQGLSVRNIVQQSDIQDKNVSYRHFVRHIKRNAQLSEFFIVSKIAINCSSSASFLYNLTQERLSERIGKKRATIANFLRLLKLPAEVQLGLRDKLVDCR